MAWTLLAVGDVMLGDHPVCFGHGVRSRVDAVGLDDLLAPVLPLFRSHEYVLGNLESPLADAVNTELLLGGEMLGRSTFAKSLRRSGFRGMSVANNHALHHGERGFSQTLGALVESGIDVLGARVAGCMQPVFRVMSDGSTCAFLAFSTRPEYREPEAQCYARPSEAALLEEVHAASRAADAVIVSMHWGREYIRFAAPSQRALATALVEAGATVIVGHHPHVVQEIERRGRSVVAFSLGNFCFDTWLPSCRRSIALSLKIDSSGVEEFSVVPLRISRQNYFPAPGGHDEPEARDFVSSRNRNVPPEILRSEALYEEFADLLERDYRWSSYAYFIRHMHQYSWKTVHRSIVRAIGRRANG